MPASDDALGAVSPHQSFVHSLLFSARGPSTARSKRLRAEAAARRLHQSSTTRIPGVIKYNFRLVALVFILCAPVYFYSLVQTHTHVAVTGLLFAAEALAFVLNLLFFFNFWFATERNKVSLRSFHPRLPEKDWPHVDLCFTHFLEPVAQLHDPLAAALTMDYPPDKLHIKILDDGYLGKRGEHYEVTPLGLELEQMVQDLLGGTHPTRMKLSGHLVPRRHAAPGGMLVVTYIDEEKRLPSVSIVSRMKGEETFFKTGNVENALYNAALESPFVALFDGDTEPHRDFLTRTLPLFYRFEPETKRWRVNWEVGFVQTRQRFKNVAHRFGPDDPLNQSNGVFFSAIQAGRDGLGMADSLGTNEIYFRPALDDALGLVYGPLSGDLATGVKLHNFGWKGLYLNAVLAEGLCRNTVGDTLLERKRWVVGSIQMLLLSLNWRALFSARFLVAPLRLQTEARLAALLKRPERFVNPLADDDVGYEARQMRRESFWMGVARRVLFLETTLRPLGSLVAFAMIILALVFMLGNVPPLRFFHEGGGWTYGLIYLGIVASYQFLRLFAISLGCYSLFLDGTSGQDVWREVQGYFTFAWVSALGIVEAVAGAVSGRRIQWETQKKGLRPLAELPNVFLLFVLFGSICIAFVNIFVKGSTERRTTMDSMDAVAYGVFLWVCIWPSTRCTLAALARMPLWSFKMPKFVWTAAGIVIGIAIISIMGRYAQPAPNIGAFERNDYPTGPIIGPDGVTIYQNASLAFQTVFWGPNKIFLPADAATSTYDTGGYVLDSSTGRVSSQLMGYAMMIAVQLNQRTEFDALWRWVQSNMMPQPPSPYYGYVASQVSPDGTILNPAPFPDAEQYMATALMFAGSRWQALGPDGSGDYRQAAYDMLETMLYTQRLNANFANSTDMFNGTSHLVTYQPDPVTRAYIRTATLNPAFYEVWRRFAPKRLGAGVGGFWEKARDAARVLLSVSGNLNSGLFPELVNTDGSPNKGPDGTGDQWSKDTWMVQPNLALDVIWWDRNGAALDACVRYTNFLLAEGVKFYGIRYQPSTNAMLEQGLNFTQRVGLVAVNAMPAIAAGSAVNAQPFFDAIQQIDLAAIMTATNTDRAFHGLLYLLGLLTSSGRYRVFDPNYGAGPE